MGESLVDFKDIEHDLLKVGYCRLEDVDEYHVLAYCQELGTITVDPRNPAPMRPISPQSRSVASPNTLSSRYGVDSFPFHTDGSHWAIPPQFLALYCSNPGNGNRATYLIDTDSWLLLQKEIDLLISSVWITGFQRPRLCGLAVKNGNRMQIRYDPACVRTYSSSAKRAERIIVEKVGSSIPIVVTWYKRDLLILDNWRILHARGDAIAEDSDRIIQRVLIGGRYASLG